MNNYIAHRDPRRFSTSRITTHVWRRMRLLSITEEDVRHVYTFGTQLRSNSRTWIMLRNRDIHPDARQLEHVMHRAGILLEVDHRGCIRDIARDRNACRKQRSRQCELGARPRHCRIG